MLLGKIHGTSYWSVVWREKYQKSLSMYSYVKTSVFLDAEKQFD